jgi:hypothetical protein
VKLRKLSFLVLLAILIILSSDEVLSQCPMCRMSAESNLAAGGTEGKGLNKGILYMLALPYLMVSILGFLWYKNKKKNEEVHGVETSE